MKPSTMHFLLFSLLIGVLGALPLAAQHDTEKDRRREPREQLFHKRLPHPNGLPDGLVESPAPPMSSHHDRKRESDALQRLPGRVRERLARDWDLSKIEGLAPADSKQSQNTDEPAPSSAQTSIEPVVDGSAIQMISSDSVVVDWIADYTSGVRAPSSDIAYALALDGSGNVYVTGSATFADGRRYTTIKYRQITTGIAEEPELPREFVLYQNYPNPFNPATTIKFNVPTTSDVTLKIFDILGHEVATIVNELLRAGSYVTAFDASKLASGTYFYRLQTEGFVQTKKMIVAK